MRPQSPMADILGELLGSMPPAPDLAAESIDWLIGSDGALSFGSRPRPDTPVRAPGPAGSAARPTGGKGRKPKKKTTQYLREPTLDAIHAAQKSLGRTLPGRVTMSLIVDASVSVALAELSAAGSDSALYHEMAARQKALAGVSTPDGETPCA